MKIPFGKPILDDAERNAVMDVLAGPILVHGPKATEFEDAFAGYTGAPNAVSVSSCTAGLHLVYFAKGIGAGDEVIVPAMTHTATAHAVELAGATPVFVDAESQTGNIDINAIEAAITKRTKAISIVHFLGMPVDMERVNGIAAKHGLLVVEDAALAVGTMLDGVHAGLLGDVGVFSFYPVKHMTTAEGGMIITRDKVFADDLRLKKAFGVDRTHGERKIPGMYDVVALGFNYRMSEIHAAIGIEQIKKLPDFLAKREANYQALERALSGVDGVTLLKSSFGRFKSSYYCLSAILDAEMAHLRPDIMDAMKTMGVGTSVYYPQPVPRMTYYREKYGYDAKAYPNAERISDQSIALPVGPHLSEDDMKVVAAALKNAIHEVTK